MWSSFLSQLVYSLLADFYSYNVVVGWEQAAYEFNASTLSDVCSTIVPWLYKWVRGQTKRWSVVCGVGCNCCRCSGFDLGVQSWLCVIHSGFKTLSGRIRNFSVERCIKYSQGPTSTTTPRCNPLCHNNNHYHMYCIHCTKSTGHTNHY